MTIEKAVALIGGSVGILGAIFAAYHHMDERHEPQGSVQAALEVMLGEVEDDRAASIYWLNEEAKKRELTPYEMGRKGALESSLKRVERMQESLENE